MAKQIMTALEVDLLRAHASVAHYERQIREYWQIRRAIQKRNGMARLDGWGKSERYFFLIKSAVEFLRTYRAKVAILNAEVDRIEALPLKSAA